MIDRIVNAINVRLADYQVITFEVSGVTMYVGGARKIDNSSVWIDRCDGGGPVRMVEADLIKAYNNAGRG